jgi:hypothetical protein
MIRTGHSSDGLVSSTHRKVLRDPCVRQRIVEYLGGRRLRDATCAFLARTDSENPAIFERQPPEALDRMLEEGGDVARSLEDRLSMLIHLDIEYVNFDDPAESYLNAPRIFRLQEPLVEAIEARLLEFGIRYLHLVTGQGHHFVWRIPRESPVARAIAGMSICSPPDATTPEVEPLFPHLALIMEHFAHLVKKEASTQCAIPVEITAQHVGPAPSGMREMLSIDLSEYGDPLHSRMIRIPYTVYRKPWLSGLLERMGVEGRVNEFFTLPLHEMGLTQLLKLRHQPAKIIALARRAGVNIPLQEKGTARLMDSYLRSPLCRFHRSFYAIEQDHPSLWATGYDRTPLDELPPCAAQILAEPNDRLLKPSGIHLITRCLLALGWQPRHIAGLVRSKFANPRHGWGDRWCEYDPATRAEFYVRLFAGQIATGLDTGVDFNCLSQQEKQFCWNPRGCSMEPFREKLNRLFNPEPTLP